jgi:hypothetical protein
MPQPPPHSPKEVRVYTEEVRALPRRAALLALPVAFALAALAAVLVLVPLPATAQAAIGAVVLLYLVACVLFVASMSRVRIAIDDAALTVAFRFLFAKRYALERIASCAPTDAQVWALSYRALGTPYRPLATGGRAVLLQLSNGAQVVFPSGQPDAACAALRARRPEIADAANAGAQGRTSGAKPGSWAASVEAESREWQVRCGACGYEESAWDRGWIRWKAAGTSMRYMRCPNCGKRSWHTVYRRRS